MGTRSPLHVGALPGRCGGTPKCGEQGLCLDAAWAQPARCVTPHPSQRKQHPRGGCTPEPRQPWPTLAPGAQALLDIASDKVDGRRSLDEAFYDHCVSSASSGSANSAARSPQLTLRIQRAQSMDAARAGFGPGSGPGSSQPPACLAAQARPQRDSSDYSSASSTFASEDGRPYGTPPGERDAGDRSPRTPIQRRLRMPDPALSASVEATGESPRSGQKRWAVFRRSLDAPPMPPPSPQAPAPPSCMCGAAAAGGSQAARAAAGCTLCSPSSKGCCSGKGALGAGCTLTEARRDPHGAVPVVQAAALRCCSEGAKAPASAACPGHAPAQAPASTGSAAGPSGCTSGGRGAGEAGAAPASPAGSAPGRRSTDLVTLDSAREMPPASLRQSVDARGAVPARMPEGPVQVAPGGALGRTFTCPPLPPSAYIPATLSAPGSLQAAEWAPDTPPGTPPPVGKPPAKRSPDSSASGGTAEATAGPCEPPRSKARSAGGAPKRKGCRVSFSIAPEDEPGVCAQAGELRAAGDGRCISGSSPVGVHPISPVAGMDCAVGPTPDGF